jgi:hypothetical protein
MRKLTQYLLNKKAVKANEEKVSSYDTTRAETNTPQKVREGEEPEAIRQRLEKAKGVDKKQ